MANYLNHISRLSHQEFHDGPAPLGDPDYRVSFEGDNMPLQQVGAWQQDSTTFIFNSSMNPDTWFRASWDQLLVELFPSADVLITPGE
jgi:hypothetical protein